MPEYFYLRGFLVDSETLRSLTTAYQSPNYTQEMQEFFQKTTKDFDADRVLNLDKDNTNNFAVFDKSVKMLSDDDAALVSANEDNNTYVFQNADSITSMKQGDTFAYAYEDGSELIVKVDSVKTDGDTVTVTGMDTSMEDVFEYVKIDTTSTMSDVTVDDSACDEDVQFNGFVENTIKASSARAIEGEEKTSKSLSYTFYEKKTVGLSGDVLLKIGGSVKFYISLSYQYVETKIDYEATLKIKVSKKYDKKIALGFIGMSPIPGVYIEFTPSFVVEVSAAINIEGKLKGTIGFRVDSDAGGIENISKTPSFQTEVKGEITLFIGLSMEPKIKIISDKLSNASLDATVGAEIKGTQKLVGESSSKKHECKKCVDGDISAKAELKVKAEFFNSKKLTFTYKETGTLKIFDFYYSKDYDEFAFTTCPHYLYKVTVTVQDANEEPITGAVVSLPFILITEDEQGEETKTEVSSVTTGKDGKAVGYLRAGAYSIEVSADGYDKSTKKITIVDNAKSVKVSLETSSAGSGGGSWGGDDSNGNVSVLLKNAKMVSLGDYHSGVITEDGSLYMWGGNWAGQLGDGTTEDKFNPVKVLDDVESVSLGTDHSAAITKDGSLYMWGNNSFGELGDGTTENKLSPIKVMDDVVAVSLGSGYSGAITKAGSLYMWGFNFRGQLGDGTTEDKLSPVKVMDKVVSVSLGGACSGAITEDGSLYMWGFNFRGQLGDGTTVDKHSPVKIMNDVVSVSLGDDHGGAITEDSSLYMWGYNYDGELGDGTTEDKLSPVKVLDDVVSISLGGCHSGATTEDGSLYMWGYNECGEIGDGTTEDKLSPIKVLGDVVSMSFGNEHSGAITEDGSLYMWGRNVFGGVGDGTTVDRYTPVKINITTGNTSKTSLLKSSSSSQQSISLKAASSTETADVQTATFSDLTPNTTYTFYVMRDRKAKKPLASSNLLYIIQATADGKGKLSVSYKPTKNVSGAAVFAVKSGQGDSEEVSPSDVSKNITVTFAANGGKKLSKKSITLKPNTKIGKLPTVERKNYIFKGWYTKKSGGTKVTKSTKLTKSTTLYAHWSKVTKPKEVSSLTVKSAKSGKLSVSFKKVSGAKGYVITYSTSKKFTSSTTKKVAVTSTKKTLTKLKKGKTYYVKVRAYKTDSTGKKIYGAYSKVKKIKVK
jgi:uncharacterized repeat protein (TIGR02543 family)